MSENLHKVDHAALRVNQITIITLNILAFVLDLPWLAALVALAMILGTALKNPRLRLHLPLCPETYRTGQAGRADG